MNERTLLNTDPVTHGIQEIVQERGREMLKEVKERHKQAGQYVTGKTSNSLRIVETADGFQLVGWKYAGTYDEGRAKGKMPPVDAILAWVQAKGLTFTKPYQARNYAYCIARKIAKEGTRRYRHNEDIWRTPIEEMSRDIASLSTKYLAGEITRLLLRTDINQTTP